MRTSDIDKVGDESHLTFFEMVGNFSFGYWPGKSIPPGDGYWKKDAIEYAHEFITKEMGLKIDYVSVFGDEGNPSTGSGQVIPADEESEKIWKSIDSKIKVKKFGRADNFWGPTGDEGPCGPTSEIYVNGVEIWNLVFNEYYQAGDKSLSPLKTQGIDTGMGLERLAMVVQKVPNIFETDLFEPFRFILRGGEEDIKSGRIIADHIRAAVFLISDRVTPSNKGSGYILRRLIRRAMAHSNKAEIRENILLLSKDILMGLFSNTADFYGKIYPDLSAGKKEILSIFEKELDNFGKTLINGLREFDKRFPGMRAQELIPGKEIEPFIIGQKIGEQAFDLYQTYGFPFEVIKELLEDRWYKFDEKSFQQKLEEGFSQKLEEEKRKHQEKSRAGIEKKFGGHGLILDTGELKAGNEEELKKVTRLHTATHLLHAALRKVLGEEVHQAGSDITAERLRFDFTFSRKLTPEEIKKVEDIVNDAIGQDLPVTMREMPYEEAIKKGAMAFFKQKYPEIVKVYTIGDEKTPFSRELCGGPHVERTGNVTSERDPEGHPRGNFKITKEESISAGTRRIKAVTF